MIFLEYAIDVADACRERGVASVAVTAGYATPGSPRRLFSHMDAANVDLKGFTEGFYAKTCAGHLEPVLETLEYLVHETEVWVEVTTLLIPGLNDSDEEARRRDALVRRATRARRAAPLHGVPSGLETASTGRTPPRDPHAREEIALANGSGTSTPATSTTARPEHLLPPVRSAARRA